MELTIETQNNLKKEVIEQIKICNGMGFATIVEELKKSIDFSRFNGSYKEFRESRDPELFNKIDDYLRETLESINEEQRKKPIALRVENTLKLFLKDISCTDDNIDDIMKVLSDTISELLTEHFTKSESEIEFEVAYNLSSGYVNHTHPESSFEDAVKMINDNNLNTLKVYNYLANTSKQIYWSEKSDTFHLFSFTDYKMSLSRENIDKLYEHYKDLIL